LCWNFRPSALSPFLIAPIENRFNGGFESLHTACWDGGFLHDSNAAMGTNFPTLFEFSITPGAFFQSHIPRLTKENPSLQKKILAPNVPNSERAPIQA
jgi:hypothetical protein